MFIVIVGTFISAPFSLCEKDKPQKTRIRNFFVNLLASFLQIITTPLIMIGWFWSIMWAIEYLKPVSCIATATTSTTVTTITTATTRTTVESQNHGYLSSFWCTRCIS